MIHAPTPLLAGLLLQFVLLLPIAAPTAPEPERASGIQPPGDTVHIVIRGAMFYPREIHVPVGAVVVWTNADPLVHTITARDGSWGSPALAEGGRFEGRFDVPGRHEYLCLPHPAMTGAVVIGTDG
jgi:plastocyanin